MEVDFEEYLALFWFFDAQCFISPILWHTMSLSYELDFYLFISQVCYLMYHGVCLLPKKISLIILTVLLSFWNSLVFSKKQTVAEWCVTFIISTGLLPCVCSTMIIKTLFVTVGFPTVSTFTGLLSCVCSLMQFEIWTEGSPTLTICKGFLPGVCSLMLNKRRRATECFPTCYIFIGLLSCVFSLMSNKVWVTTKVFPHSVHS